MYVSKPKTSPEETSASFLRIVHRFFFLSDISVTGFVGSLELVQVLCKGNAML